MIDIFDKLGISKFNIDSKGELSGCLDRQTMIIKLPDTVKSIGERAFAYSDRLLGVTFSSPITSIGYQAFLKCHSLSSMEIPDEVTVIGGEAFCDCESLTEINIPKSIQRVGAHAFSSCKRLKDIRYPDVESIPENCFHDDAFKWIRRIENLYFPSLRSLYAFSGSLPPCENVFVDGKLLTELDITEGVESLPNNAFSQIKCIKKVRVGGSVKRIGSDSFKYLDNMETLELVQGLTSVGARSFSYNNLIKSVVIPQSLEEVYGVFDGCKGLKDFHFESVESFMTLCGFKGVRIENLYIGGELVKDIVVPRGVKTIKNSAFMYLDGIETITLPDTVTEIEDYAIIACDRLRSFNVPSSVEKMGRFDWRYLHALDTIYFDNEEHLRFIDAQEEIVVKNIYVGGKKFEGVLREEEFVDVQEETIEYPTEYFTMVGEDFPNALRVEQGVYCAKKEYTEEESKKIYDQAAGYIVCVHEDYDHDDMGSYEQNDSFKVPLNAVLVSGGEFVGCLIKNGYYSFSKTYEFDGFSEGGVAFLRTNGEYKRIHSSETSRSSRDQYAYLYKKKN